jgi:hypothetical protein
VSDDIKKTGVTLRLVTRISNKHEAVEVAKKLGILGQKNYDPENSSHVMSKS